MKIHASFVSCNLLILALAGCGGQSDAPQVSGADRDDGITIGQATGPDLRQVRLLKHAPMSETRALFEARVGHDFELLYDEAHLVQARLLEMIDGIGDASVDQFSLVFSAPAEPVIDEGIYRWRHAELGMVDLYVVPDVAVDGRATLRADVSILLAFEDSAD